MNKYTKKMKLPLLLLLTTTLYAQPFRCPVKITSEYGATTGYGGARRNRVHEGIDLIPLEYDWIIFPVLPGEVVEIGISSVYGKYVVIDHGDGLFSKYAHGSVIYESAVGQVDINIPIMRMGSSGFSDNNHLHLEVYRVEDGKVIFLNPIGYVKSEVLE